MKSKPGPPGANAGANLVCRKASLPATVAQTMIRALQAGQWTGELPGERKLCELLQVSRVTLRPALRQLEDEGWLRTVPGQRRVVTTGGKGAKVPASTGRIILISPLPLHEIEPFVLLGIDNLRELLARRHMILETETRPECYGQSPAHALSRLCREFAPDVWLLWRSTKAMQDWFFRQKLRHVVLGSVFERNASPSVDIDHVATAHHAATTFGRMGHHRIAVIVADSTLAGDLRSVEGFCAGAEDYKPVRMQADTVRHDGTPAGIVRSVDHILALVPRPTGIFSAGGRQTIAIMTRLLQLGLKIPQEMSVISRDDDNALDFVTPAPGRYYRPPIKFARGVFRQIERQRSPSSQKARACSIFPDFLPRETLARPPASPL